jgi:hypothetical protein
MIHDMPGIITHLLNAHPNYTRDELLRYTEQMPISFAQQVAKSFIEWRVSDTGILQPECTNTSACLDLLNKSEDYNLSATSEQLLLNRSLYHIADESTQDILHPIALNLLAKYNLTLFNKEFEPNRGEIILQYYKSKPEFAPYVEQSELLLSGETHEF